MKTLTLIAAFCLVGTSALAPTAQAKDRHSSRDFGAYTAIAPQTRGPVAPWHEPYPYADEAHATATGGPSGGLPGGS